MTRGELNVWLAPKLEQAARQIAIWATGAGASGDPDSLDYETVLQILREKIGDKP